jgi:crossover junction endodeoxyribonuclease RuvC
MNILGIDPGAHGAIAVLDERGSLIEVHDTPSTERRTAGQRPTRHCSPVSSRARVAFCEFVAARPTDAKASAFQFGRARGVIEGVAGALSLPIVFLTPPTWKRLAEIPAGEEHKDLARTRAIARWPARADLFARKCDVDRAKAALIGWAGLQREPSR